MLRASVTVFYGLIFHEEGSDAEFSDVIWGPLDRDEVHCTDEAAVLSAGELLGAIKPTVPFNNRDPKVFALYQAWWAEARRKLEESGCTFVRYGDMTDMTVVRWGVAVAASLHQTESFTFALALDAEKLVVQATWNEMLQTFCDLGLEHRPRARPDHDLVGARVHGSGRLHREGEQPAAPDRGAGLRARERP